ncbi:MAG TPA: hypothetical protein VHV08_10710 [Pirellulales bacterium]|nr:hypothetical protein [Pirellulales bacterium]
MRRVPWVTYFWPGLPQLWGRGLWSALALAIGFGLLLNLLLLTSYVWVELLSRVHLRWSWLALGSLWALSAGLSALFAGRMPLSQTTSGEALFRQALSEYLQGSWFEAEAILGRLLRLDPRDVDARLLLATLLRHTARWYEALEQLDRLERLRDADKWAQEIAAERQEIAEGMSRVSEVEPEASATVSISFETRRAA